MTLKEVFGILDEMSAMGGSPSGAIEIGPATPKKKKKSKGIIKRW